MEELGASLSCSHLRVEMSSAVEVHHVWRCDSLMLKPWEALTLTQSMQRLDRTEM